MKPSEIKILNSLSGKQTKHEAFTVEVKRYFTDATGAVIDKNTIPTNLKTSYPFYLWQRFDKDGGFKIARSILPPLGGSAFLYSFEFGTSFDYFQFSGFNTVSQNFRPGDLIIVYGDDPVNINYLIWVVIHCDQQAYTSMLHNVNGEIKVKEFLYTVDNVLNYNQSLHFLKTNPLGLFIDDQFQPLMFKTPDTVLNDFIRISLSFDIQKHIGFYSYFDFATELMLFNFKILI